ncbi:MAG: hypothetical protein KA801_10415 [Syntrophorhabdaceae bacterium]|nr:hypothetical protein [Syntrophorhabdaceae bacterium]
MAKRQWRSTDGGIYALDFTAVCLMAQAMNIKVDGEFVSRVCAYEDESVPLLQRKGEENTCTEEEREYCRLQFGDANFAWACRQCGDMKMKKKDRDHG